MTISEKPNRRLGFSWRSLFVVLTFTATFFAGRASLKRNLEDAEQRAAFAEQKAQAAEQRAMLAEDLRKNGTVVIRSGLNNGSIDAGMKVDALEREFRWSRQPQVAPSPLEFQQPPK